MNASACCPTRELLGEQFDELLSTERVEVIGEIELLDDVDESPQSSRLSFVRRCPALRPRTDWVEVQNVRSLYDSGVAHELQARCQLLVEVVEFLNRTA